MRHVYVAFLKINDLPLFTLVTIAQAGLVYIHQHIFKIFLYGKISKIVCWASHPKPGLGAVSPSGSDIFLLPLNIF
jgi:hypothetical protein